MKTVKRNDVVERVTDAEATERVKAGWEYCSKAEWKKIRPRAKPRV